MRVGSRLVVYNRGGNEGRLVCCERGWREQVGDWSRLVCSES